VRGVYGFSLRVNPDWGNALDQHQQQREQERGEESVSSTAREMHAASSSLSLCRFSMTRRAQYCDTVIAQSTQQEWNAKRYVGKRKRRAF
jgi:hypothetical protein